MADLVRSRIDAFVAARIAATSTTAAPTTTTRAPTPTTGAAAGPNTGNVRALSSSTETVDDVDPLWFVAIGAAVVVLAVATVMVTRRRARARSRDAG
jgi:hypothetical protein